MLHPGCEPTAGEFQEYLEYAIEGRRRVKEQLNKRKPDDEFANINLGYVNAAGDNVVVFCKESQNVAATQDPRRPIPAATPSSIVAGPMPPLPVPPQHSESSIPTLAAIPPEGPKERHYRIHYGATGFGYDFVFGDYLPGAEEILVEDPYIRVHHQIVNFLRFCETALRLGKPKRFILVTKFESSTEREEALVKLSTIAESLKQFDATLEVRENATLHDREVRLSNGWSIKIGRGFDIYQRPDDWLHIGANDLALRPCLETNVDIVRFAAT